MAGGKATRMHCKVEKPMLYIADRPMIAYVIEALKRSVFIERIIVAVTPRTPETASGIIKFGVEIVQTDGNGYESDMKQAVKTLGLDDVLVVSADLPFLSLKIVDEAISEYLSRGKPSLMVAAPVEMYYKSELTPSYVFELHGQKLAPIGLNVINGRMIDEQELEETVLVAEDENLIVNVNTLTELELARRRHIKRR
jgi:adenosylcobinamide-phosphate guanylyltransferase